ncbi:MAG: ribose-phosphate pyrophosphokinase [Planctomycetota bacterium]|nr:ribose-phosphate pyrophosphokinase [Planctomycetota bacterium]
MSDFELKVLSGNAHPVLAEDVCRHLGIKMSRTRAQRFPDGEIDIKVEDDMRGCDVFVIQPTSPPVNENLMELLVILDCLRRASAGTITAVIPYFGYARLDRKAEGRVPITAKLVANLIVTAGADRVLALDFHSPQIQGFFDISVDELLGFKVIVPYIKSLKKKAICVLSPDVGGTKLARVYSKQLNCEMAVVDKRRVSGDTAILYNLIGDVAGKDVILVDDIIATGGTIVEGAKLAKEKGASSVIACSTHGVFAGDALKRIAAAPVEEVIVTNSIPQREEGRLRVLSIAPLLSEAIHRIHNDLSISAMFD